MNTQNAKPKPTLNFNIGSHVSYNAHTTQHKTVLTIFPLTLQTITTAQMLKVRVIHQINQSHAFCFCLNGNLSKFLQVKWVPKWESIVISIADLMTLQSKQQKQKYDTKFTSF